MAVIAPFRGLTYDLSIGQDFSSLVAPPYDVISNLLNPTRIEQVREIASLSLVMPRKSTYFYPKVLTGLVFNKIDPYEIIQVP